MAGTRGTSGSGVRGGGGSSRRAPGSRTAAPETAEVASVRTFPDRGETGDGLTQRQRRVLEVIRDSIERRG